MKAFHISYRLAAWLALAVAPLMAQTGSGSI
jgi:hypothetical protein